MNGLQKGLARGNLLTRGTGGPEERQPPQYSAQKGWAPGERKAGHRTAEHVPMEAGVPVNDEVRYVSAASVRVWGGC